MEAVTWKNKKFEHAACKAMIFMLVRCEKWRENLYSPFVFLFSLESMSYEKKQCFSPSRTALVFKTETSIFGTTQSPQRRRPVAGDPDEVVPCYETAPSGFVFVFCAPDCTGYGAKLGKRKNQCNMLH
jgi:hypothetical protein